MFVECCLRYPEEVTESILCIPFMLPFQNLGENLNSKAYWDPKISGKNFKPILCYRFYLSSMCFNFENSYYLQLVTKIYPQSK